jgi:hypothetical protein
MRTLHGNRPEELGEAGTPIQENTGPSASDCGRQDHTSYEDDPIGVPQGIVESHDLETEEKKQPATKKARWNGKGMTFLMFMKPDKQATNQAKETNGGPRTMLGSLLRIR